VKLQVYGELNVADEEETALDCYTLFIEGPPEPGTPYYGFIHFQQFSLDDCDPEDAEYSDTNLRMVFTVNVERFFETKGWPTTRLPNKSQGKHMYYDRWEVDLPIEYLLTNDHPAIRTFALRNFER
jgi:hypothetical protein